MKNIHISLTEFRNESRLIKELQSLSKFGLFDDFLVIALGAVDLPSNKQLFNQCRVVRLNLWSRSLPKSSLFQLFKFIEFAIRAVFLILKEKPQVVNVHTLALLPVGFLVKIIVRSKLIYDAHELETEKNGLSGWRKKVSKIIERFFIRYCDLIIVVGDCIADWYAETYDIERPLVVKNSPRVRKQSKQDLFREKLNIRSDQKILLYQGGLVQGRGVRLVLDAFLQRKSDSVVVVFMGYGALESEVKEVLTQCNNVYFCPAVPPEVVLDYTSSGDIGISYIENTCLSYFYCMPNKLFEYAMAGLPVLVSDMKEMANVVNKHNFGSVINKSVPELLNDAIDQILNQDLAKLSEAAFSFAESNSWEMQEKIMIQGYRRMLG